MTSFATPNKEQLIAFDQASRLPRWTAIDAYITAEADAALARLLGTKDTAEIHELRGYVRALKQFQQTARDAGQTLVKMGHAAPLA